MSWRNSLIGLGACGAGLTPGPTPGGPVGVADPGIVLGRARGLFTSPKPKRRDASKLPLQGVHRAIEAPGNDGQLWVSVHDLRRGGAQ